MTPEEYQRFKEAEKEHLRKLRELKKSARDARRQQSLTQAIQNITGSADALDTPDEMMDQLARETAMSEARLDIALEEAQARQTEAAQAEERAAFEEDLRKARAQELVRQMKLEAGLGQAPAEATPADPAEDAPAEAEGDTDPPPASEQLPEKTIGRMKP